MKDLQAFLGTANYVRAHAGPAYSRIAAPLRVLLRAGAVFPPNKEQQAVIQGLKDLLAENHVLAVPDEAAAIAAANAWMWGTLLVEDPMRWALTPRAMLSVGWWGNV